jgi:drug/metabolite transporter (DMT)-like permease
MLADEKKAYLDLHIATIFFGLTAILGAKITLVAVVLVWWRVFLTGISLSFIVDVRKHFADMSRKELQAFTCIGMVVALHWVLFYASIKMSNPSIALVCFATTSLFTSFLEPFIFKTKIQKLDVFLGLLVVPTLAFIVFNIQVQFYNGIIVGLISAFLAAYFATMNKKYMKKHHDPKFITFIEMWTACGFLTVYMPFYLYFNPDMPFLPRDFMDWAYLIFLALFCTTLAFYLALRALNHVSAFTSNLIISLEPVYGIILAAILLKDYEMLNIQFYIGCALILGIVLSYPILIKKYHK